MMKRSADKEWLERQNETAEIFKTRDCSNCAYWERLDDNNGLCHHPSAMILTNWQAQPTTNQNFKCIFWEKRKMKRANKHD